MYPEKAWHVIAYEFGFILFGLVAFPILAKYFGVGLSWLTAVTCDVIAILYMPYLIANEMGWLAEIDSPHEIVGYQLPVNYPIPDNNVYAQDVGGMTPERLVAFAILGQKDSDLPVNLTEKFWITEKHFEGSREQWALMMRDWESRGAVKRKGRAKNSGYEPYDWREIRRILRG